MDKKRFCLYKYNLLSQSMFNQHRFFILNSIKLSPTCISLQAYTFQHVATCMSVQKKTHIYFPKNLLLFLPCCNQPFQTLITLLQKTLLNVQFKRNL